MAYSDSSRVTENTKRVTTTGSVQTDVRAAVNTFGDSMETIFATYGAGNRVKQAFRDKMVDLMRYLDVELNA